MYITTVSTASNNFSHLTMGVFFSGSSCPVTNATEELYFLWVNGIPEYIAAPIPEVIPGIISNGYIV